MRKLCVSQQGGLHPRISIDSIFEILGIKKPCWYGKLRYPTKLSTNNQQGEVMIPKTVLPFKLETTSDSITSHAGLALLGEFAQGIGLSDLVDGHLPLPGSGAGYRPSQFVMPLVLMLNGGGQALEDLRQVRQDTALRDLLALDRIPSSDAVGNWLRRVGMSGGLYGLDRPFRQRGVPGECVQLLMTSQKVINAPRAGRPDQ
jgi:hypothetical protein